MRRVTVAVPETLMIPANHVHVLLEKSESFDTYTSANWQDEQGNRYAVSSGIWTVRQINGVKYPQGAQAEVAQTLLKFTDLDLGMVFYAQAMFLWGGPARPDKIVAITGDEPNEAINKLNLTQVSGEE